MKRLQYLKNRKGFTLVELIVVIAIIGVLAAILIPTMIGYVRSANIASADQTAALIRKTVTNVMAGLETKGCAVTGNGLIATGISTSGGTASFEMIGTDVGDGIYTTLADANIKGSHTAGDGSSSAWTLQDFCDMLKKSLDGDLSESHAGYALIVLSNGVCAQAVYCVDENTLITIFDRISDDDQTFDSSIFNAAGSEEGVIDGVVVGTNPKIYKSFVSEE